MIRNHHLAVIAERYQTIVEERIQVCDKQEAVRSVEPFGIR
jgi:hypothetical protein